MPFTEAFLTLLRQVKQYALICTMNLRIKYSTDIMKNSHKRESLLADGLSIPEETERSH